MSKHSDTQAILELIADELAEQGIPPIDRWEQRHVEQRLQRLRELTTR